MINHEKIQTFDRIKRILSKGIRTKDVADIVGRSLATVTAIKRCATLEEYHALIKKYSDSKYKVKKHQTDKKPLKSNGFLSMFKREAGSDDAATVDIKEKTNGKPLQVVEALNKLLTIEKELLKTNRLILFALNKKKQAVKRPYKQQKKGFFHW